MGADRLEHGLYDTDEEEENRMPSANDSKFNMVDSIDDGRIGAQIYWGLDQGKETKSQLSSEVTTLSAASVPGAVNYGYEHDTKSAGSKAVNEKGVQCNLDE